MNLLAVSRLLAVLMILNEAFVVLRTPPEEREHIILPPFPAVAFVLMVLPFFFVIDLPAWLAIIAVTLQASGLFMEVYTEIQLTRAKSFGVVSDKGTQPQTSGFYRFFEHPIYVGILLQMVGWGMFMPLTLIAVGLNYFAVRQMVQNEREYLTSTLNFSHSGLDTLIWR